MNKEDFFNMDDYLIIDTKITTNGHISQIQSFEKNETTKLTIKQYSGINTDNFIIYSNNGKKISFGFFSINGIYYINLNGEHIIDYYKFIQIKKISYDSNENCLKISNNQLGDIYIPNCDTDVFAKALSEMNRWMKNKYSMMSSLYYLIFT